jgi:NADH-quinone oxidoreductase subunit H
MQTWLSEALGQPSALAALALLAAGVLVSFIAGSALVFIWLERKIAGRIQDRLGPTRVGGRFGWLQTVADGIKLLTKEDTMPARADPFLFRIAPYIAFCGSFVAFLALPFGNQLVARELDTAIFFMLAVLSSEVFGVILAGWGSGSKWSLFGGIREAAQVVSYEVPRALTVLLPVMLVGSLSLTDIAAAQQGWFWSWHIFHDPFCFVGFFTFFICATASCKRAPFDLAEAESELVAGFHTEYSGLRWSFFFMAEYGSMFAVSGLATLLYLGGWHTGLLPFEPSERFGFVLGNLLNLAVFIAKSYLLVMVMMWARWSLPRLRIDQVMTTCLKYLLPISCVLLVGLALWQLAVPVQVRTTTPLVLAIGSLLGMLGVLLAALTVPVSAPRGGLPGVWANLPTPLLRTRQR